MLRKIDLALLTNVEHILIGGSTYRQFVKTSDQWHTPIAVLAGTQTVNQVARQRKEEGEFYAPFGIFLGKPGNIILTLEDLDERGNTLQDPRVMGIAHEGIFTPEHNGKLTRSLYTLFINEGALPAAFLREANSTFEGMVGLGKERL